MCKTESLCCTVYIGTLLISCTSIKKKKKTEFKQKDKTKFDHIDKWKLVKLSLDACCSHT